MLVKFSCGCVGFPPENSHAWIIKDCTRDRYDAEYNLFRRDVSDKTFELIDSIESGFYLEDLSRLICDGNRLREIKNLLS